MDHSTISIVSGEAFGFLIAWDSIFDGRTFFNSTNYTKGKLMKLSIVLSTHAASFKAVAFKGDFETNLKRIASYGYDGVEPAIRDPRLVDHEQLIQVVATKHGDSRDRNRSGLG